MCQIALSEGHKETDTLYARHILCQRLDLLVMQKVHILVANLREIVFSFDLHRFCLYPVSILPVGTICGNLTQIDLRVKVGRKRIAVIATVAV